MVKLKGQIVNDVSLDVIRVQGQVGVGKKKRFILPVQWIEKARLAV